MRKKRSRKRWTALALAGLLVLPAVPAQAGVKGGTYAEVNKGKLQTAGIKEAAADALELELAEKTLLTAGEDGQQSMDISADVPDQISGPCGTVQIPSTLSLGGLKQTEDNIQPYEIRVSREDPGETVTVSAPDGGTLYSGKEELPFANDFGIQTVQGDGSENMADTETEAVLNGTIIIRGKDVAEAAPGNYTGVTTFTITCGGESTDPGGEEDTDNPDDQKDPSDPGDTELDIRDLEDGVYSVTGNMVKVDKSTLSMADNAINHTIKLTVKNGVYLITLDMKGMNISGQMGYLGGLQYFLSGYTEDKYGYPQGKLGESVVESYQTDENGERIRDEYGTDYPDLVTFELIPEALEDGFVPLRVSVPVMDSISEGLGDQSVYLALDWASLKVTDEDDPAFTDEDDPGSDDDGHGGSGLNGGSGLGGNTLPGGSSLGGGLPGSGSLGNSSLGGRSLQSGSGVKTGDSSDAAGLWTAVLAAGCACVATGMAKIVISRRNTGKRDRRQRWGNR